MMVRDKPVLVVACYAPLRDGRHYRSQERRYCLRTADPEKVVLETAYPNPDRMADLDQERVDRVRAWEAWRALPWYRRQFTLKRPPMRPFLYDFEVASHAE